MTEPESDTDRIVRAITAGSIIISLNLAGIAAVVLYRLEHGPLYWVHKTTAATEDKLPCQ